MPQRARPTYSSHLAPRPGRLAKVLSVSIDYLLRDDLAEDAAPAGALRDHELLRKLAAVEQMDEEDRRVISFLIDAYIKKHQIEEVLHQ